MTTVWQTHQLLLSKPDIDEQCEVVCSRNRSSFELKGLLHYAHGSHEDLMTPDMKNLSPKFRLADLLTLVWKSVLLPDLKIWLATALVALVLAIVGILLGLAWLKLKPSNLPLPLPLLLAAAPAGATADREEDERSLNWLLWCAVGLLTVATSISVPILVNL